MIERHTYYLAHLKRVFGPERDEEAAFLYATYMRHLPPDAEPGRMDGSSLFYDDGKRVVLVIVGNSATRLT